MSYKAKPKNITIENDKVFFKRWTVLGVDSEVVQIIKKYSKKHNVTTGRALKELIMKVKNV